MVAKWLEFVVHGKKGLVQPALKSRRREYLRIIYRPDYVTSESPTRVPNRGLGANAPWPWSLLLTYAAGDSNVTGMEMVGGLTRATCRDVEWEFPAPHLTLMREEAPQRMISCGKSSIPCGISSARAFRGGDYRMTCLLETPIRPGVGRSRRVESPRRSNRRLAGCRFRRLPRDYERLSQTLTSYR